MDQPLPIQKTGKLRILVAPLDWGLGHATRCIPIIKELLTQGCDVWLAGEGAQEHLLKTEFPELPFLQLEGYRVHYSKSGAGMLFNIFRQSAKIIRAIQKENNWMKKMMDQHVFDAIISDNRYGLYHEKVPSVFITHQLTIKSSLGRWTEKILQKRNYNYINHFSVCWIPDNEEEDNLAGELSHPVKKPSVEIKYIGILSRFYSSSPPAGGDGGKKGHLLIILSGPEPQRAILENVIVKDISHYNGTATVVRGLPGSSSLIPSTNMIQFYNHLPAAELNAEMLKAEYVIARSGYSTVMDITTLQKKAILIPTPGQTEQEYLAKHLMGKRLAWCTVQKNFSLTAALEKAENFSYNIPEIKNNELLQQVIGDFVASLSNR
jgi:hypothetical protein